MSIVRSSFLVLLSAAVLGACRTHKNPVHTGPATDARWAQVDSLAGIGQYATALELSGTIRSEAVAEGDWRTEFKAWMHVLRFRAYTGGDMQEGLRELEQRAAEAPIPLQQVLYSVAAEQWWNHYQQRRWQVLERTEMSTAAGPDAETWTQGQYMSHILGLYQRSMQELDTLRRIPSSELGELLIDDGTARASRPSLFDVLAHRALEVLSNPETRLTEPTWRFQLEGATPFTLFEPWILRPLAHRDSSSWLFQALRIHQQLERTHLNRDPIDGLVDATLDRLTFVHTNSSAPDRDSLLLGALDELRSRLPNDSSWSMVTARIAQWHADLAASYDRSAGDAWKWEAHGSDHVHAGHGALAGEPGCASGGGPEADLGATRAGGRGRAGGGAWDAQHHRAALCEPAPGVGACSGRCLGEGCTVGGRGGGVERAARTHPATDLERGPSR
ncbi:MAG: hypothetical protein IPM68_08345 [Flavobacteriales bacterium]|nr:hypothetical protein [Flavobacteriales bacterium]